MSVYSRLVDAANSVRARFEFATSNVRPTPAPLAATDNARTRFESVGNRIRSAFEYVYATITAPRASLLSFAVRRDSTRGVKFALFLGADINNVDAHGNGFLHQNISKRMTAFLINRGIEIERRNFAGDTPMHIAVRARDAEKAKLLSDKNVNVHLSNMAGKTAIQELSEQVATITETNRASVAAKFDSLASSVLKNFRRVVDLPPVNSLTNGDDFSTPGFSLIHYATNKCNAECVRLIATRANANQATTYTLKTPLMYATAAGNLDAIHALANVGANPTIADSQGRIAKDYIGANDLSAAALENALLEATPVPLLDQATTMLTNTLNSLGKAASEGCNNVSRTIANSFKSVNSRHVGYFGAAGAIAIAAAIAKNTNALGVISNRFKSAIKGPQ